MNRIALRLAKLVVARLLPRACKSHIPRVGGGAEFVNCFILKIDQDGTPPLVIKELIGDEVKCLAWDGQNYALVQTVSLRAVHSKQLLVKHYYGHSEIEFHGLIDYALNRASTWPYIKIHTVRAIDRINRYFFNKRKLITKKRTELLKHLLQRHLVGKTEFDSLDLLTDLYSIRWVEHPDRDIAQHQVEYFLDAMVETGELKKINHVYVVTGKALQAIELFEEQERRHTEGVKTQRSMVWLTVVLTVLAAVQAGLVRFNPLLDFTK